MRKIFTVLLYLIICSFILVGCNSFETDETSINIAKESVVAFYEKNFVLIPVECIEYIGYDNKLKEFEFCVDYNPREIYPDLFDKADNVENVEATLYVKQEGNIFKLYNADKEQVFVYYDKNQSEDGSKPLKKTD